MPPSDMFLEGRHCLMPFATSRLVASCSPRLAALLIMVLQSWVLSSELVTAPDHACVLTAVLLATNNIFIIVVVGLAVAILIGASLSLHLDFASNVASLLAAVVRSDATLAHVL